jgi:hypothetical protein
MKACVYTRYMITTHGILLRMRNISDKVYRENQTHILCSINFIVENRGVYEIIWKNILEPGRLQMTIWRLRIACWVTKATTSHSEYVILIAFPLQHRLHERAPILRYTYIAACFFRALRGVCAVYNSFTEMTVRVYM